MKREAFLSSATLHALKAYENITVDLTRILKKKYEIEDTSIRTLFYGGMILSGIDRIVLPDDNSAELPDELASLATSVSQSGFSDVYAEIRELVWGHARIDAGKRDCAELNELSAFLAELIAASNSRRPLLTTFPVPLESKLCPLLKREFHDVVRFIERSVDTIELNSPLLTVVLPRRAISRVQTILSSDLFRAYSAALTQAEQEGMSQNAIQAVDVRSRTLVNAFDRELRVRTTLSRIVGLVPDAIDALAGKLAGRASKIVTEPLTRLIEGKHTIQIYSFHPVWKEVWEDRLKLVEALVNETNALKAFLREVEKKRSKLKGEIKAIEDQIERSLPTEPK